MVSLNHRVAAVRQLVRQHKQRWEEDISYLQRETFEAFLKLPAPQRKIVREVIQAFTKAQDQPGGSGKG